MTIKMNVNENTNLTGTVTLAGDNAAETQVMYMSASLNADTMGLNINVNVTNKDLYKNNAADMKAKYDEFKAQVETRAKQLGYIIF